MISIMHRKQGVSVNVHKKEGKLGERERRKNLGWSRLISSGLPCNLDITKRTYLKERFGIRNRVPFPHMFSATNSI